MRKSSILLVLIVLLMVPVTAFAQDDAQPNVFCMPEGAPLGDYNTSARITLQRGDEPVTNMYVYYRLSSVIENGGVCAVSGWMTSESWESDNPDFSDAAQFQLLATEDQIVLSISNTYLLNLFGLSANFYDGGVTYMVQDAGDGNLLIEEIHTSVAQLQVLQPEVKLRFEPVTQ